MRPTLPIDDTLLRPGLRLAVGLSGGADSVALLRVLAERRAELGLVLHAAHLNHGLRGDESNGDLAFCHDFAAEFGVLLHEFRVDTRAEATAHGESIEEAARRVRYRWFRELMASGKVDAIATAHTRDDQAETVLAKFLRGAWTEGLSGIHPVVEFPEGKILRPLLSATRGEVEAYLTALGQSWREDSSNRDAAFTRNRIRHELLPLLETWNPRLRDHMAQMADLARDEDAWWQAELARVAPQMLLTGSPVRGGGRAGTPALALDVTRLAALPIALQRRLLRHAAQQLGAAPDFAATEALRALALNGRAGQRLELAHGLRAERSPRELRLSAMAAISRPVGRNSLKEAETLAKHGPFLVPIPGEIDAPAFGLRLRIELDDGPAGSASRPAVATQAVLRNWRPGDRVRLRYSSGPRKVKEVLERLRVTGSGRTLWPVLELASGPAGNSAAQIVWMRGVEVEPAPGLRITATFAAGDETGAPSG